MKKVELERLLELKDMIVSATSFGEPWDFFFDHFGENPSFIEMGDLAEHPILEAVVEKLAKEIHKHEEMVVVTKPMLKKLDDYHFFHGSFLVQGRMGIIIFFEDIDMGLMSLTPEGPEAPTLMMRFSTYQVGEDKAIHLNPRTSEEVN